MSNDAFEEMMAWSRKIEAAMPAREERPVEIIVKPHVERRLRGMIAKENPPVYEGVFAHLAVFSPSTLLGIPLYVDYDGRRLRDLWLNHPTTNAEEQKHWRLLLQETTASAPGIGAILFADGHFAPIVEGK